MAEITTTSNKKQHGFPKSTNRRSTRVDLTPMVDLGFLLITFFVFTTSLTEAKVMTLIEPKTGIEKPVPASGAMTIIIGKDHQLYYYFGTLTRPEQITKANFKDIRDIILEKKNKTEIDKLMYIIKPNERSTLGDAINLLDEMQICMIPSGHYAEVEMTQAETVLIKQRE
ncbi:MAG TPA: biopolymer transporter ExbD [Ferruginibacter sp.]|nr:biopolymer transporter ExbD [Ferruginibacter sp.]